MVDGGSRAKYPIPDFRSVFVMAKAFTVRADEFCIFHHLKIDAYAEAILLWLQAGFA